MPRRSGQRGGTPDPAAIYMGAMQTPPAAVAATAIRDLIYGLITAGLWPAFECLWLCNLDSEQASRLNAVDPRIYALTDSAATPAWASGVGGAGGFTASSGSRLDTGWNFGRRLGLPGRQPSSRDSVCVLYRSWTAASSTAADFGDANRLQAWLHNTGGVVTARIGDGTSETMGTPSNGSGLFGVERAGNADKQVYRNGSSIATATTAGLVGSTANTVHLLGTNGVSPGARRMSLAAIAGAIGAAGHATVSTLVTAFETTIGAT